MKYLIHILGCMLPIFLYSMELNNFKKKYESPGPEKLSICVPDIDAFCSVYNRVLALQGDNWIPFFRRYRIDPFTAGYVLCTVRGDKVLPKELWCYIFQFLKFDSTLNIFDFQNTKCRFIGYIPEKFLTKKIFSFEHFNIEMDIGNNAHNKIVIKNRQALIEQGGYDEGGYETTIFNKNSVIETLKKSGLMAKNTIANIYTYSDDEEQIYGLDVDNLNLKLSAPTVSYKPFVYTSFRNGKRASYTKEITVTVDTNYDIDIQLEDWICSSYAWLNNNNIWLIVETINDDCEEKRHHNMCTSLSSKHCVHVLKKTFPDLNFQTVTTLMLPLLVLDRDDKFSQRFANSRCSVTDVIDGNILIYDSFKKLYGCFQLFE